MAKLLEFEQPIKELYEKIDQLKLLSKDGKIDLEEEISKIEKRAEALKKDIFSDLTPHQIVQIARHPSRPDTTSLARLICDNFTQLYGDRLYRDDPSIVGGIGMIGNQRIMLIGHQKGHDTKENIYRNFGMPHPEGYRKALRLMKLAEKFSLPVITLIDTPGAYPGVKAEYSGQHEAIAKSLEVMSDLKTPIVNLVIGEGGSGGGFGIGLADTIGMLEYSIYSVASPEACASILWRTAENAEQAADALKLDADNLVKLNIIDSIVKEPMGGAHRNHEETYANVKEYFLSELNELSKYSIEDLTAKRYNKFIEIGV